MMNIYIFQLRLIEDPYSSISVHLSKKEAEDASLRELNGILQDHGYPSQTDLDVAAQMCCDLELAFYEIDKFEMRFNNDGTTEISQRIT
jgi:hypothetical protein